VTNVVIFLYVCPEFAIPDDIITTIILMFSLACRDSRRENSLNVFLGYLLAINQVYLFYPFWDFGGQAKAA